MQYVYNAIIAFIANIWTKIGIKRTQVRPHCNYCNRWYCAIASSIPTKLTETWIDIMSEWDFARFSLREASMGYCDNSLSLSLLFLLPTISTNICKYNWSVRCLIIGSIHLLRYETQLLRVWDDHWFMNWSRQRLPTFCLHISSVDKNLFFE